MRRPSRRTFIAFSIAVGLSAGLASAITAAGSVSHYRSEHVRANRVFAQHDSLVQENRRLEQVAESRLVASQQLDGRLSRSGNDLRYAMGRWNALKMKMATLQATAASLKASLAEANAQAKSSYSTGYDAGVADASASLSTSTDSTTGDCDPNYEGACVPTGYGDVNCGDLFETDFDVVGDDIYGLDGDNDGIACESY